MSWSVSEVGLRVGDRIKFVSGPDNGREASIESIEKGNVTYLVNYVDHTCSWIQSIKEEYIQNSILLHRKGVEILPCEDGEVSP